MGNIKGLVTLLFFKIKSTNLASWGILMQIFQNCIIPNSKLLCQYDVIIGIFQGPVTLPFLKVSAQNLVIWGILTCSLKFQYFISIVSFTDTLWLKMFFTLITSL